MLRGIHWVKEKALLGCLFGAGCMVAGSLLYLFSPYEGTVVIAVGMYTAVLSFCLVPLMLLSFLGVGFAVSLMVQDNPVAKLVGGLLVLAAIGTLIAQTLGEFDPVGRADAYAK